MTQSRASAKACSDSRRSAADSDEWETKVVIPRPRSIVPSSSASRRESTNTRRFSPECSAAMTFAAFSTLPTESTVISGTTVPPATAGAITRPGDVRPPCNQPSSSSGLPTVADIPTRCSFRPSNDSSRASTASRCQPRSSPAKAWTSSTTTACTPPSTSAASTLSDTSIDSSDSGVVSRTSGRSRLMRSRTDCPTSPCHVMAPRPIHAVYSARRGCRLFSRALSGHRYSTEMPRHRCCCIRVRIGNIAASVLPPAVGANRIASDPAAMVATASSCSGRRPGQPSELTMWCWRIGSSWSKPAVTAPPRRRWWRAAPPPSPFPRWSANSVAADRSPGTGRRGRARRRRAS